MLKRAFVDYRGIPLHLAIYETGSDDPTLIFVHGMSMHAGGYIDTIPGADFLGALSGQGFNVIGLDLQGHGRSGGPRGLFTYKDLMGNISRAVDYALEHYNKRIGITGSSMGGVLSFYAALEDKRIRAAVCHCVLDLRNVWPILSWKRHFIILLLARFLGPFSRYFSWLPVPVVAFLDPRYVFDRIENIRFWLQDPLCVRSYRFSSWISVFLEPADKPAVEDLHIPIRIIVGENDRILPANYTRAFFARLGCRKDLVEVPGVGHMLPLEHLNITAPLVAEWFWRTL